MKILVLNSGSSTQKSALFDLEQNSSHGPIPPLWEGKLEWDGDKETLHVHNHTGQEIRSNGKTSVQRASVAAMLENSWSGPTAVLKSRGEIEVAGHRIVHGGAKLTQPVRITPEIKQEIENVASIAPLAQRLPGLPDCAVER